MTRPILTRRSLFMLRERDKVVGVARSLSLTHCRRVLRSPLVHGRPSLCRCVLSITSADLEAVLYRVEGMPGMAW